MMCDRWAGARGRAAQSQEVGFQRVEGPCGIFGRARMGYKWATGSLRMSYEELRVGYGRILKGFTTIRCHQSQTIRRTGALVRQH